MTNEMMYKTFKMVSGCVEQWAMREGYKVTNIGRLYTCSASLYKVENGYKTYYVLKSYNTVIAVWDVNEGILIDALRAVYGYTNTSAQHISKFQKWIKEQFGTTPAVYRVGEIWNDIKRIK